MTLDLEQDEAIDVLSKIRVLPIQPEINVERLGNERLVHRQYQIEPSAPYFSEYLVIEYTLSGVKDIVTNYNVYLMDYKSKIYLCKYSPKIVNTLFNNIILLELSNWRRITQGLQPLREIEDYSSLMFELNIDKSYTRFK